MGLHLPVWISRQTEFLCLSDRPYQLWTFFISSTFTAAKRYKPIPSQGCSSHVWVPACALLPCVKGPRLLPLRKEWVWPARLHQMTLPQAWLTGWWGEEGGDSWCRRSQSDPVPQKSEIKDKRQCLDCVKLYNVKSHLSASYIQFVQLHLKKLVTLEIKLLILQDKFYKYLV